MMATTSMKMDATPIVTSMLASFEVVEGLAQEITDLKSSKMELTMAGMVVTMETL